MLLLYAFFFVSSIFGSSLGCSYKRRRWFFQAFRIPSTPSISIDHRLSNRVMGNFNQINNLSKPGARIFFDGRCDIVQGRDLDVHRVRARVNIPNRLVWAGKTCRWQLAHISATQLLNIVVSMFWHSVIFHISAAYSFVLLLLLVYSSPHPVSYTLFPIL